MDAHQKTAKTRLRQQLSAEMGSNRDAIRHVAKELDDATYAGRPISLVATRDYIQILREVADNLDTVGHSLSNKEDR
ncbi:hypothetical protein [Halomonas caseinilytica]|uniref:hypothetical protein n=1 Tax=Halomonas caseinilytica TaxID=438744 RepID=UPI000848E9D4|nr:hypothetical protein [Halomonas caseinilytica]